MLLDFDESKMEQPEFVDKLNKLKQGIENNYPEALPDKSTARSVHKHGSVYAPLPVAFSLQTPLAMKEATDVMGRKLTHALYLRESNKRLTTAHSFLSGIY